MSRAHAFSLIELLLVLVIVALLAALIAPALNAVKAAAHKAGCAANLGQIGLATSAYMIDNGRRTWKEDANSDMFMMRKNGRWNSTGHLLPAGLIDDPKRFRCPAAPRMISVPVSSSTAQFYLAGTIENPLGYGWYSDYFNAIGNINYGPYQAGRDGARGLIADNPYAYNLPKRPYHRGGTNVGYLDARVSFQRDQGGTNSLLVYDPSWSATYDTRMRNWFKNFADNR